MNRKITWEKWIEPEIKTEREEEENMNMPVLFTTLGYITQKLYAGHKNDIKFWVGNTNFNITQTEGHIINQTPGVEIFNVMTRYKFRISAGKSFRASDVREAIEINLGCQNKFNMKEENLYSLKAAQLTLRQQNIPWLIFILPNGKFEWYQNKDSKTFNEVLLKYKDAENLIPGHLIVGV
jgi:hypothetical protein